MEADKVRVLSDLKYRGIIKFKREFSDIVVVGAKLIKFWFKINTLILHTKNIITHKGK